MPKIIKNLRTRNESKRYAGSPSELPTFRQVIQYSYLICKNMYELTSISSPEIISKVTNELISLLSRVNPKLPLTHEKSVAKKISRLLKRVLSAEGKCKNANKNKEYLDYNFEHLFDLSSCGCGLPVVACNNRLGKLLISFLYAILIFSLC